MLMVISGSVSLSRLHSPKSVVSRGFVPKFRRAAMAEAWDQSHCAATFRMKGPHLVCTGTVLTRRRGPPRMASISGRDQRFRDAQPFPRRIAAPLAPEE